MFFILAPALYFTDELLKGTAMILWKKNRINLYVLLAFCLSGCASTAVGAFEELAEPPVRIFFATDRNHTDSEEPGKMFGSERGEVSYGICAVSIPSDHRIGELESPIFSEDIMEHVVLADVSLYDRKDYFSKVAGFVDRSADKHMLVFVHGYNMTFKKAARRMAQVVRDLDFNGCPVLYSWPSRGKVSGYPVDETNVRWSEKNLKGFLEEIAVKSGAESIFLIAHSMGNRAVTGAFLELISERPLLEKRFKALLLTAPDIDAGIFRRDMAESLEQSGVHITIYVSSKDKALELSKRIHGFPRVGEVDGVPLIVPGIETIDASSVDTSFLGHSYYNGSRSVLSDMFYIINEDLRANERFSLEAVDTKDGRYWRFKE